MNEPIKIVDNNKDWEIRDWLSNRYYYISQQGNQIHYYDSLNDQGKGITAQHLTGCLLSKNYCLTIREGLQLVKHTNFKPINLNYDFYRPEQPPVIQINGHYYRNLWRKPEIKPSPERDFKPFYNHLIDMLGSNHKADYLIDMLAYRYQKGYVKSKPQVAFWFYSDLQGMGKNEFQKTLIAVFGKSAVRSPKSETDLVSMSSIDLWRRTWCVMQEGSFKVGSSHYNDIKVHTGTDNITSDRKGEHFSEYEVPAQLIVLSNHAPNFLESNDRRFFISKWEKKFETQDEKNNYFKDYLGWLYKDGYSAIAGLLVTRDISHIKLEEPALMTPEKESALVISHDPVVEEIKIELAENKAKHLWVKEEFQEIFDRHSVKNNQIKYKLQLAGLRGNGTYKYKGKSAVFFTRDDYSIRHKQGKKPLVVNPKGITKDLEDFDEYSDCITVINKVRSQQNH